MLKLPANFSTTGLTIKFNMQKHLQISRFYSLRLAVKIVTTLLKKSPRDMTETVWQINLINCTPRLYIFSQRNFQV